MTEPAPNAALLRIGGILCFSWILWAANSTWYIAGGFLHPLAASLGVVLYALFFLYGFLTLQAKLPDRYAAYVIVGIAIALVVRTFVLTSVLRPGIETDGLAISLSAAHAVLDAKDPYAIDHINAFSQYHLSPEFNTPRLDGTVVSTVTYPALSFLLYVIPELVGMDPRWVSVGAFILTLTLLAAMAPRSLRTLAPLVLLVDPNFINYILGLQDIAYVPLVAGAAYFWTELPVLAGVLLGLGAAVKQEPWLAVPFFALGVFLSRDGDTRARALAAARALGAVAAGFLMPNILFIAEGPQAWFRGVMDPFAGQNVEWGSGFIGLVLANGLPIHRWMLTALGGIVYVALLLLVWRSWPKLRDASWLAPGLSLFFAPRALENYYLYLVPICLASWLGSSDEARAYKAALAQRLRGSALLRVFAAASAVVVAGCAALPTSATIANVVDSKDSGLADRIAVDVRNGADRALSATYLVIVDGTKQYLWSCLDGCGPIPAGSSARVVIGAPGLAAGVPAGSSAAVAVVDRHSGDEFVSAGASVPDGRLHLADACLCVPADLSYSVPAGWRVNLADFATGVVRYSPDRALGAVTMTLVPGALRQWTYQTIHDDYIPFAHPIDVGVSKMVLYRGGLSPTQYAGVSVDDGKGHSELFVWGEGSRLQAYQGSDSVIIVEPAATQRYLFVDAARFAAAAHFAAPPPYTISFVVAALGPNPALTATFTGFHVGAAENRISSSGAAPKS